MAKIISFINYKGGVGKTTTTYHIGCSLAQHHDKKVLLVDIDPQTNLTFLCAKYEEWIKFKNKNGTIASLYRRYQDKRTLDVKRFIWKNPINIESKRINNIDLIPCDIDLLGEDVGGGQVEGTFSTFEAVKRNASIYIRERLFLERALNEVIDLYDYILIDCPPNLYLMTQNALLASNKYLITAIPDHLSTIGLAILIEKVNKIGKLINKVNSITDENTRNKKVAEVDGIIFVKVRIGGGMITNTHISTMSTVRNFSIEKFNRDICFLQYTTELIGFSEAAENQLPVWMFDSPNAKRAANKREYERITEQFLGRF